MSEKIKLVFRKKGAEYPILDYSSNVNVDEIKDMREFIYTDRTIQSMITANGLYDLVGNIEFKRVKYHIKTIMYGPILE